MSNRPNAFLEFVDFLGAVWDRITLKLIEKIWGQS